LGGLPQPIEMSWQRTLTLLTALTMVARFSTPALILIVRVPARPFVGERYFNAQHAKERLRATQPG